MSRLARATALTAVLLTAVLAGPAGAIAARPGDGSGAAASDVRGGGWFSALLGSAWDWLQALVDEDNGHIMP